MGFSDVCKAMKNGEMIEFGFGGHILLPSRMQLTGTIIGIRPESGVAFVNCWLLNICVYQPGTSGKKKGEKIEVFWRED